MAPAQGLCPSRAGALPGGLGGWRAFPTLGFTFGLARVRNNSSMDREANMQACVHVSDGWRGPGGVLSGWKGCDTCTSLPGNRLPSKTSFPTGTSWYNSAAPLEVLVLALRHWRPAVSPGASRKGAGWFHGNAAEISWVCYGLKFQIWYFCHGALPSKSRGEIPGSARWVRRCACSCPRWARPTCGGVRPNVLGSPP